MDDSFSQDAARELYAAPQGPEFYDRNTVEVARDLIGRMLLHEVDGMIVGGRIVEAEAYGEQDEANHAFKGMTPRNRTMFAPPGSLYVYKIYGMYWCSNAVTGPQGVGEAALVRALEPAVGVEWMTKMRRGAPRHELCKGPGNLSIALGLGGQHDGSLLYSGPVRICGEARIESEIVSSRRVNVTRSAERLWRFYEAGTRCRSAHR